VLPASCARRSLASLALAGVLGGLLYLTGDFLFYGRLGSAAEFRSLATMASRSDTLLIAGGVVGPIASAGYILGTLAIYLQLRERQPRVALTHLVGWSGMFLAGIAYHALYATRGFAAKLPEEAATASLARLEALMDTLYAGEASFGIVGTIAFAVAVLRGATYPRWTLLLLPTLWSLASFIADKVPAPVGALVKGGWINGWFTTFFFVAYLVARRLPTGEMH
jgi:hypothetical protein